MTQYRLHCADHRGSCGRAAAGGFAAAWAFLRGRVPWPWMLGGYLVLRFLLLGTMENPEPRYTIQCFPIFIVAAAAAFGRNRHAPHLAMRQSTSG